MRCKIVCFKEFKKIIKKGYIDSVVFNNFAYSFILKKDYKNAILFYKKALSIDPKDQDALSNLTRLKSERPELF